MRRFTPIVIGFSMLVLFGCQDKQNGTAEPIVNTNEIARIQANTAMPEDAKKAAIARLQAAEASGKAIGNGKK